MKKNTFIFSSVGFFSLLVAASVAFTFNKDDNLTVVEGYTSSELPTTIDLNDTDENDIRDYYSSLEDLDESERQGTNLLKNLKEILKNGQKYYSYDYNYGKSVWQIYEISDRDWKLSPASSTIYGTYDSINNRLVDYQYGTSDSNPKNNPYIHALYMNRDVTNQANAWDDHEQNTAWGINREHIWAKSHGMGSTAVSSDPTSAGARGDPMHLWAASGYINGYQYRYHNNYFFGFVDKDRDYIDSMSDGYGFNFEHLSGNYEGYSLNKGGYDKVFEPQDSDKGDIARAIFYMAARYNYLSGEDEDGIDVNNPNLVLTDNTSDVNGRSNYEATSSKAGEMGILRDLLAWNRLDPPDEYEIHRNNLLYNNYTNNRNPFIDYPQWAEYIWGSSTLDSDNRTVVEYNSTPTYFATPSSDVINSFKSIIHPSGVTIDNAPENMEVGDSFQLQYTVYPEDACDKRVLFSTSNENIITIDDSGLTTAVGGGSAYVYVYTVDGGFVAQAYITVTEQGGTDRKNLPGGTYSVTLSITGKNNVISSEQEFDIIDDTYKNISLSFNGVTNPYDNEYTLVKKSNNGGNASSITVTNNSNATITTVEIDWYNRHDNTYLYKNGIESISPVSGTGSGKTKSDMQVYTVNGTYFTLVNDDSSYDRSFYTMKINLSVSSSEGGHAIYFDANDSASRPAANMPSAIYDIANGETKSNFDIPTRWGYNFVGWGLTVDATSYVDSITINGTDVSLHAIWEADYTASGAWEECPYTVSEACAAIDAGENLIDVYVSGIISQIDSYNSNYHSLIYWISEDGTTSNQFEIYSGKNLDNTDFNSISDIELGSSVVVYGTIKKYYQTYEFQQDNYLVSYSAPERDIDFTFNPRAVIKAGEEGLFSYECEVQGVAANYVSSNPSVLEIIDSSTGAYRAKAIGNASITLTLTKGSDSGSKIVNINVAGVKTISEVYAIAASLNEGVTTTEYYYSTGYVINTDADGNARAIDVTDGTSIVRVFFGANDSALYETVIGSGATIGTKLSVFGQIQNYSGTYEIKNLTIDDISSADADSYAAAAYMVLNESCETGPSAVDASTWNTLSGVFAQLASTEREKLSADDVSEYGDNVIHWVNRYSIICSNTTLNNFMARSDIVSLNDQFNLNDNTNTTIIFAVIGLVNFVAVSGLLFFKKKKSKIK